MLKNFLLVAVRNIKRQKSYSFINILGLTVGIAITLVIAVYVIDDLSYDRIHPEAENIYRVLTHNKKTSATNAITSGPLLPAAKENIPEVITSTRTVGFGGFMFTAPERIPVDELSADNSIRLRGFLTEPNFFEVFSFKILEGDRENALITPNGILITPQAAELLYPGENPIGKAITLQHLGGSNGNGQQNLFVIGIVEPPPLNSHIQYDFIIPFIAENNPVWWNQWIAYSLQGYVKLTEGSDIKSVEQKLTNMAHSNNVPQTEIVKLQPLLDVHLGSTDLRHDWANHGRNDKTIVYTLAIIGFLIISVAAINFINLSSARASKRAREVGMRKVIGSNRTMLITQFLGESVFLTLIATTAALIIVQLISPGLNDYLGKTLQIDFLGNQLILFSVISIAIVIGILAGIYPALILSSFKPVTVLKGSFTHSRIGEVIRKTLVLFQFSVTIALTSAVIIILNQIDYLKTIDMGYNRDQVVTLTAAYDANANELLKSKLLNIADVKSVGRSNDLIGSSFNGYNMIPEGASSDDIFPMKSISIDNTFFETLEINIISGRQFTEGFPGDTANSILINETAAKKLGWDNPLGKKLDFKDLEENGILPSKRIIGVVKDFHFENSRQQIQPFMYQLNSQYAANFLIKLAGGRIPETLEKIETAYSEVYPNRSFSPQFFDEVFDNQYDSDKEFATNIAYFSGVAIFIACLGLIGLVAYSVEQKKKEIAVRKVLGSNEKSIVTLLSKGFLRWVLMSNIIAWPASFFVTGLWLDEFVHKASIGFLPFITAGSLAVIIALLTLSFQTIRAARLNPVELLRSE